MEEGFRVGVEDGERVTRVGKLDRGRELLRRYRRVVHFGVRT